MLALLQLMILLRKKMKTYFTLTAAIAALMAAPALAQRGGPPTPNNMVPNPQAVGEPGIAWYTTWETGVAEAKRSNRPIFFMSAAAQCSGVSGVF